MVEFLVVHFEVVLPGHPHQVRVLFKGFVVALLQGLCQRLSVLLPLVGLLLWCHIYNTMAPSSPDHGETTSLLDEWHHHLVPLEVWVSLTQLEGELWG